MGLDITAYKGLKEVTKGEAFDEDGVLKWEGDNDKYVYPHIDRNFAERADDIKNKTPYRYEDSIGHAAGSYGGYNHWRNSLAKLAGYPEAEYDEFGVTKKSHAAYVWATPDDGPFMEIINFSDCEGIIGTAVSRKLAKDFSDFQSQADEHHCDHFKRKYSEWRQAFEFASDNGLVEFH